MLEFICEIPTVLGPRWTEALVLGTMFVALLAGLDWLDRR
jgi:hypothetical protein